MKPMTTRPFATLASIAVLLSLGACASHTATRMGSAATTPLNDLNIVRSDIPEILVKAQDQPYRMPLDTSCVALALEIRGLDEALGPDLDAPGPDDDDSLAGRAATLASDQAVRAVQRTAEDLVPMRGWVRKLSGAERYAKRVSSCVAAGSARRAFLKGMAAAQNCLPRSAPQQPMQAAAR